MTDTTTYLNEMLLALEANIEYLKDKGNSTVTIRDGQLISNIGDIYIYEFTMEYLHQNIDTDTEIEIRIKGDVANGKVIATNENKIQIEIDNNIGSEVPEARLIISSYYLLELLYEKLSKVKSGELTLTDQAEKTFRLQPSRTGHQMYTSSFGTFHPNPSQDQAISLALGSEVSFIWGPPGTGKTETIPIIIEGFLQRNLSVLLISHTNVATDGVLVKVAKHLSNSDDYKEGRILREGKCSKDLEEKCEMVIPSVVLKKKGEQITSELAIIEKEITDIASSITKSRTIVNQFEQLQNLLAEEKSYSGEINKTNASIESSNTEFKRLMHKQKNIINTIKKYQSMNSIRKLFSPTDVESLRTQLKSIPPKKDEITQAIVNKKEIVITLQHKSDKTRELIGDLEKQLQGEDFEKNNHLLQQSQDRIRVLNDQQSSLQKRLKELESALIRDAKVIATTLTKSYISKSILDRKYDCVIVDEASMAPLPALWCTTGLACQQVVIVGDFRQLPPIAKHHVLDTGQTAEEIRIEKEVVDKWLKRDIFDFWNIENSIRSGCWPEYLKQLKIQYRMHPEIADVVNFLIYSDVSKDCILESDTSTITKGRDLISKPPLDYHRVGIFNTHKIGSAALQTDSHSRYNLYHALLAVAIAKQAAISGYTEIGIISPFRAQANLIQKIVKDTALNPNVTVISDTVHRFQGSDSQIIIFDLTTSDPNPLTDDQVIGGDDEKLINVAFSRAEEKFIMIADVEKTLKDHSPSSLIRKFIKYAEVSNIPIISSENILPKYIANESSEKWLIKIHSTSDIKKEIENSTLFDDTDFYQCFMKDLAKAKHEVVIDSPFITSERTAGFIPIFKVLISEGVKIFVITRDPESHKTTMKTQALVELSNFENIGVTVLPFPGNTHHKLAVIDRKILWEGSLNILSQRDSKEIMRRFIGEATAKQMMSYLKWDKNIGEMGENNLQRCEFCTKPGAWYWTGKSKYGIWTGCLVGNHKKGVKPKKKEVTNTPKKASKKQESIPIITNAEGTPLCPIHNIPMEKRPGRYGIFWGCPKFPDCTITRKAN